MSLKNMPSAIRSGPLASYLKGRGEETPDAVMAALEQLSEATLDKIERVTTRLTDLEQSVSGRTFPGAPGTGESIGQTFAADAGLQVFARDRRQQPSRYRMDINQALTTGSTSGGSLTPPARDGVVMMPRRRMTIRDLLPSVPVTSNTVEFPRQTDRTNNSRPVTEGSAKPESSIAFALDEVKTVVIAHWIPASVQVLDDAPQLAGIIDGELRYGLALTEEGQLLNGDGTGQNLDGLIPNATAFTDPIGPLADETMIDQLAKGLLQSALAHFPADGIILHPADWMRIRLLKDGEGRYLMGSPTDTAPANLFGVPVVPTPAMEPGEWLVGAFQAAATIYDRWETRVEISTEHADFFVKNMVAIRAEERLALGIKQPLALTYGSFDDSEGGTGT